MQTAIEHLGSSPQHTQNQEDAYEWRQVGNALEDRNEDQTANTQPEHSLALTFCEVAYRSILLGRNLRHHEFALQHGLKDEGWNHHGNHRWDEDLGNHTSCGYQSLVPKHDGGNVADGRESATRVGCNDDKRGIYHTVLVVGNELTQNHNHHDTGSQVVEDGRKEEGKEGYAPQQSTLRLCLHHLANPVESAILVYYLYDRHGSHQEEEGRCSIAKVFLDNTRYLFYHSCSTTCIVRVHHLQILHRVNHVECPAPHEHEQGYRSLVYLRQALCGYESIAKHKDDDNRNC